jgi:hypothetical protein
VQHCAGDVNLTVIFAMYLKRYPKGEVMFRRLAGLAIAVAVPVALLSAGQSAAAESHDSSSQQVTACSYAAYAPNREGSLVRGWGEKWGCGGSTWWTITVQRHRGASWWQNEARNFATGDGWVSAAAGCVSGTWTYRTILESDVGHKTVSAHRTITC